LDRAHQCRRYDWHTIAQGGLKTDRTEQILEDEKKVRDNAPKVMQDSIKDGQGAANAKPPGSRSFSTFARRQQEDLSSASGQPDFDASMIPSSEQRAVYAAETTVPALGHKFPLPVRPIGPNDNHQDKYRYDSVVNQVTNLIMQDGKKAAAQRNMAHILTVLRTAPPPTYSATRSLLPGAPPASHLPLNPVLYLTLAIDSVAPLLRLRSQKGAAGGGVALQIPVPLGLRQRRRQAMEWILDAVSKKKSRSSGRNTFPQRLAEEFIGVIEGKSAVWTRRDAVHKLGTTARSNLTTGKGGRR
jgi:small subunit ribosomal protein S7